MMNKGTIEPTRVADEFHVAISEYLARDDLRCMPACAFDVQYRLALRRYGDPQLGHYAHFLARWLRAGWRAATLRSAPPQRADADLLVLTSRELDDTRALAAAARHIGVDDIADDTLLAQLVVEQRNVDTRTGGAPMRNDTRHALERYFAASNAELHAMIGIDFRRAHDVRSVGERGR